MNAPRFKFERKARSGFTIVELLVTVAVIAILASLLLPALSRAKARADLAVCKNNVHQIGLGLQLYANDFEGEFPPGYGNNTRKYWYRALEMHVGAKWPTLNVQPNGIVNRREGTYVCPGYSRARGVFVDAVGPQTDSEVVGAYAYNIDGLDIFDWSDISGAKGLGMSYRNNLLRTPPTKDSEIVNPADMIALGDSSVRFPSGDDHGAWSISTGLIVPTNAICGFQMLEWGMVSRAIRLSFSPEDRALDIAVTGRRHSGSFNVGFVDGHIEAQKLEPLFRVRGKPTRARRWAVDNQPHSAMLQAASP
jgi:prepilin-type N-terminal cleavage/methylation domain-containing protein/prepilin-type processing-associated H-X9-DG protein